ncbi:unnamed protein product [Phyllotreta striolata]|uniref:Uncharacterized protein n=1 Tax=Phyllotreta striolata TaxID=444603 RepID=A0A9N9TVW7_PHYSR|nr:unnamed protein product [Phyllotreta striolata]
MSASKRDDAGAPGRQPDRPAVGRLRHRVDFFEKVWSGSSDDDLHGEEAASPGSRFTDGDVEAMERSLREERRRHVEETQLEHVTLKKTGSPRHVVQMREIGPDGSETYTSTSQEGDLAGSKSVKFEKVTVKKTIRHVTTSTSRRVSASRTPSEEYLDSAYLTQSNGNLASKGSSASSLTGRFPSEESLRSLPRARGASTSGTMGAATVLK